MIGLTCDVTQIYLSGLWGLDWCHTREETENARLFSLFSFPYISTKPYGMTGWWVFQNRLFQLDLLPFVKKIQSASLLSCIWSANMHHSRSDRNFSPRNFKINIDSIRLRKVVWKASVVLYGIRRCCAVQCYLFFIMLRHYAVSLFNEAILSSSRIQYLVESWEYLIMYIVSPWDEKLHHFYCIIDYYFPTAILFDLTNSRPINLFALLMFLIPKTVKSPSSPPASLINFNNWVLVGS